MYNIVYTNENPDWPVDIFHRYFIHNQLEPNLVELERYLISDIEVDGIEGNTFIYINGYLDDTIINKIKSLLEEENFILNKFFFCQLLISFDVLSVDPSSQIINSKRFLSIV